MSNQDTPASYYHLIPHRMIGDILLLIEALEYYYGSDGYTVAENDRLLGVMTLQKTPENLVAILLELGVYGFNFRILRQPLYNFPTTSNQLRKHYPRFSTFTAYSFILSTMPPNTLFRHEIPKALIINEPNLDSALVRTYGIAFTKTVEEDKWVILTPNITPEDLKKHLFNVGILFPESALKPEERSVPNPGFIITDEQPETPKQS